MIEYELSIFLLIISTVIMVQIAFRDFFMNWLSVSTETYAKWLFYLTSIQLIVIIAASMHSIIDAHQ
ncbi:hypothetical protein C8R34_10446 [Nitrosomonas sp. Nm84]|uniref:hypothetical protein n=1 Tax=Nitrosomonas sp. Nm84 TaxID=200124 RepID=UPI000D774A94|nr:hypothetical protein [Nitrosomonas sp. Nm84]PXW89647.1 hypothetical protein C8R34_10446 [Nitrosomonas sp. Nm84]